MQVKTSSGKSYQSIGTNGNRTIRIVTKKGVIYPSKIRDVFGKEISMDLVTSRDDMDDFIVHVVNDEPCDLRSIAFYGHESRTIATYKDGYLTVAMDENKNVIPFKYAQQLQRVKIRTARIERLDYNGKCGYRAFYKSSSNNNAKPFVKFFFME